MNRTIQSSALDYRLATCLTCGVHMSDEPGANDGAEQCCACFGRQIGKDTLSHIPEAPATAQLLFRLIAVLEGDDSRLKFQPGLSSYSRGGPAWIATSRRIPGWWVQLTPVYLGVDVRVISPMVHDPLFYVFLDVRSGDGVRGIRALVPARVREALDEAEAAGRAV